MKKRIFHFLAVNPRGHLNGSLATQGTTRLRVVVCLTARGQQGVPQLVNLSLATCPPDSSHLAMGHGPEQIRAPDRQGCWFGG